jgi:hypothetical protein
MSKLTGAALDRAVANAMGLKSVNNCEKWVGLSDEERKDLCRSWSSPMDAIYATEAKLKEKNI